jgi:hypothetical protein
MRVRPGGTADAFVTEGDINIAAGVTRYFAFNVCFLGDFTGTETADTVHLFETQGAANAIQTVCGFRVTTADVINIGIGETAPTSWSALALERDAWYCIELTIDIDAGGGNDGTIDIYITKEGEPTSTTVAATQVASLDQIAVTHGVLGTQATLATTLGTILFDRFIMDDARVYPQTDRWSRHQMVEQSRHVCVGSGVLESVSLLSGGAADCVLRVFDTDTANTDDPNNVVLELTNDTAEQTVTHSEPVRFTRGAYVELTAGTEPRARVVIGRATGFGSNAVIRRLGMKG